MPGSHAGPGRYTARNRGRASAVVADQDVLPRLSAVAAMPNCIKPRRLLLMVDLERLIFVACASANPMGSAVIVTQGKSCCSRAHRCSCSGTFAIVITKRNLARQTGPVTPSTFLRCNAIDFIHRCRIVSGDWLFTSMHCLRRWVSTGFPRTDSQPLRCP